MPKVSFRPLLHSPAAWSGSAWYQTDKFCSRRSRQGEGLFAERPIIPHKQDQLLRLRVCTAYENTTHQTNSSLGALLVKILQNLSAFLERPTAQSG